MFKKDKISSNAAETNNRQKLKKTKILETL